MTVREIINLLEELGTMLDLKEDNPFKSRAYFNAARSLELYGGDVIELIRSGKIADEKGFGKALVEKLTELVQTGKMSYYEKLRAEIPDGLFDMLKIPGLGAKKVRAIYNELGIRSIGELEYACRENRLRDLSGFGQKSQDKILDGIGRFKKYSERFLIPVVEPQATDILNYMMQHHDLEQIQLAGSLRRRRETLKDIDLVGACPAEKRTAIMQYFVAYPGAETITGQGETKSSLVLNSGVSCDLRLVENSAFAFALHHFTGSKEHNTQMRQRAKAQNLTMNEYGLFAEGSAKSLPAPDESAVFKLLGLSFIPPELREAQGEIEAAGQGELPELPEESDLCGLLHMHTTWSDGAVSIAGMAEAAKQMGLSYIGITDHSRSAIYANGLSIERVHKQHEEIDRINAEHPDFVILKGIEADILPDGSLDYPDQVLATFDFVIASVHSSFNLSEEQMTERICKAISHPLVDILGHPTGRLLLAREPYPLRMEQVLETAARHNVAVEINANPHRLDLDWRWGRKAKELGLKTVICPDAHNPAGLQDFRYGVGIARKAWFSADRVLNTLSAGELQAWFRQRKGKP